MIHVWSNHKKTAAQEMRQYIPGEDLTGVSVSESDTPELGGMIARGSDDGALWYVSKVFYRLNYAPDELGSEMEDCRKFVTHLRDHLFDGQHVLCKICGKTFEQIIKE